MIQLYFVHQHYTWTDTNTDHFTLRNHLPVSQGSKGRVVLSSALQYWQGVVFDEVGVPVHISGWTSAATNNTPVLHTLFVQQTFY